MGQAKRRKEALEKGEKWGADEGRQRQSLEQIRQLTVAEANLKWELEECREKLRQVMWTARVRGVTLSKIGDARGMTAQAVHQFLTRAAP